MAVKIYKLTIDAIREVIGEEGLAFLQSLALETFDNGEFTIDPYSAGYKEYLAKYVGKEVYGRVRERNVRMYHQMWAAAHLRGLIGASAERDERWYTSWKLRLGCLECRTHLDEYVAQNPIPFGGGKKLFEWFHAFHNSVNVRLKKPCPTLEEAWAFWVNKRQEGTPR